ncbi:cyclin-dependent kinase f-4-like [Stylonychia lemnae]|uniref:Cyclin-dependent kinase f-4-like n=1 Tax=Stylonychia lemnae TaxID=5949 RepID=A0A078AN71_STYLE|nr:cyclin-dependent kinase f-4-like [Stylonychia lemnae]|eukprot:CDW82802.1 cyclin-dependent kinase f-4-like [Stylonychia lemnae]
MSKNNGNQSSRKDDILLGQYKQIDKLGSGTFGNVYKCVDMKSGETVAIKKLKKPYTTQEDAFSLREIQVLQQLSHQNIVQMKKCDLVDNRVYMVFEHLDHNLTDFMREKKQKDNRNLSENEIKVIIKQILQGLDYMHSRGFIHRDIKPENFVISTKTFEVKLIDFGTVRDLGKASGPLTTYVSTRWYRSPEQVLRSSSYNQTTDIFAVGCVMAELFNQSPLFPGANELDQLDQIFKLLGTPRLEQWREGYKLAQKRNIKLEEMAYKKQPMKNLIPSASSDALEIFKLMFKINPGKRVTAQQLLQEPYFKNCNLQQFISSLNITSPISARKIDPKSGSQNYYQQESQPPPLIKPILKPKPQQLRRDSFKQVKNRESMPVVQTQAKVQLEENKNNLVAPRVSVAPLQKFQSEMQYIPNYFENEIPKPVQFQPGINFSLKSEVDKNRYNSNKTDLDEAFQNDFSGFKRISDPSTNANSDIISYKGLQAFPMRKDEPPSFAKRMEDERKRASNVSETSYSQFEQSQIQSPKKLENNPSSQMLSRVGSQSILQGSGSSMLLNPNRYINMNLSVKIDKSNYPNISSNNNINNIQSPQISPMVSIQSMNKLSQQKGIGEKTFQNYQKDQEEKIESFNLTKNDYFADNILSPGLARQSSKPDNLFNFSSNRDIFSPFQNSNMQISKQDSNDSMNTNDTINTVNKFVNYYQNSNAQAANNSKSNSPTYQYRAGIGLDKVEETREEHEYYKHQMPRTNHSYKPSMSRIGSEPNSGVFFNKGSSTFVNNAAQNIFGSPNPGFKNIFPLTTNNRRGEDSNATTSRLETQSTNDQILNGVMNRYRMQIQI